MVAMVVEVEIGTLTIKVPMMVIVSTSLIWIVKPPKGIWKNYLENMDHSKKSGWLDPYPALPLSFIVIVKMPKKLPEKWTDQKFVEDAFDAPLHDLEPEVEVVVDLTLA